MFGTIFAPPYLFPTVENTHQTKRITNSKLKRSQISCFHGQFFSVNFHFLYMSKKHILKVAKPHQALSAERSYSGGHYPRMERESMPKLVFRSPLRSPTEFSPSSFASAPQVYFGLEDGLARDAEARYFLNDREQRQMFLRNALDLTHHMSVCDATRQKMFRAFEMLIEYEDCALPTAQLLPTLVQALNVTTVEAFACAKSLIGGLCCSLDAAVIVEVTEALRQVFTLVSSDCAERVLTPLVVQLSASQWSSLKCVGTALLVEVGRRALSLTPPNEDAAQNIKQRFLDCACDASVLVRRAACRSAHRWVTVIGHHQLNTFLFPLLHKFLTEDRHDTIGIELVPQLVCVAQQVGRHSTTKYILHMYHALCQHVSWRVRYVAAQHIVSFASLVLSPDDVVDDALSLAADEEVEIVSVILSQLHNLCGVLSSDVVVAKLLPQVAAWRTSPLVAVRAAIASSLFIFVLRCTKQSHDLLHTLMELVDDTSEVVKRSALGSVCRLAEFASKNPADLRELIERLWLVAKSDKFRMRSLLAVQLRYLCNFLNRDQFEPLAKMLSSLLSDRIAYVRTTSRETLEVLARQYGPLWSAETLCDLLETTLPLRSAVSYTSRVILAQILGALLPIASGVHPAASPVLWKRMEQNTALVLSTLADDAVSNVRVALAKTMLILKTYHCSVATASQETVYAKLLRDPDPDVVRCATTVHEPF